MLYNSDISKRERDKEMLKELQEKMIARRTRGGANEAESRELLAQELAAYDGDNLATALCHWGFATPRQAYKYLEALEASQA